MLNTECKQCHKKWHHNNAKYCSMCGKKLVEEIEFKVGDYIATKRYVGVISRVDKVPSDYDCDLYTVGGLFYDKYLELIGNARLYPSDYLGSGRIPTKEEISEYEAALTFHKHGRNPFELKRGDVVYLKGYDKNIFLDSGNIYKKHNFIDGDVCLVKTVEEVSEWLGADDE